MNSTAPNPIGVLLVQLGTPDAPSVGAVRRYLREFLSDPRVISIPGFFRWLLLHLIILPFRPTKSAHAYAKIWTEHGSPLLVHTLAFRNKLERELGTAFHVELAMRYGTPNLALAKKRFESKSCTRILVLPLFPQYASATTGSAIEKTYQVFARGNNVPFLNFLPPFYNDDGYLESVVQVFDASVMNWEPDHILFTFHGLPETQIQMSGLEFGKPCDTRDYHCCREKSGNPFCYRKQCVETAVRLAERMKLERERWSISFQSRLGRARWTEPSTEKILTELGNKGVNRLAVLAPGFVADCLETLEEIGMRGKDIFQTAGGGEFKLISCLNAHSSWIEAVKNMCLRNA